jgi:fatty acyl-CoA reductase
MFAQQVRILPMDLRKRGFGLSQAQKAELTQNLNIIINCAGTRVRNTSLEEAVRINVTGPLQLLKLAEECPQFESFLQVSSAYVNADRTGYLHEKIYETKKNWANDYEKITNSRKTEISYNEKLFMGAFPNSMSYTKSMAEHLLV